MLTLLLLLPLLALPWTVSARADIVADDALDVCSAAADPCTISQRVQIVPGSTLDFGTRQLIVGAGGMLDFDSGSSTVIAGPIVIGGDGINAKGVDSGGFVTLSADGDLVLGGLVNGRTVKPGTLFLEATGDITIAATIDMRGSTDDSDGGSVDIESFEGSVTVDGLIKTDAGRLGLGGDIDLTATVDVIVEVAITALGGDTDGGDITIYAERDVLISGDVSASATGGAGYGGDIDIEADRHISLFGGTDADRTLVSTVGHEDSDHFSGDGGDIDLTAVGDVTIGQFAVLRSEGSAPDGYGGYITIDAEGDVVVDGRIEGVADGGDSEGGEIDISGASLDVGPTGFLVVDAANVGAITIETLGPAALDGTFSMIGKQGGTGNTFEADIAAELTVGGDLFANRPETEIEWIACRLRLRNGAVIDNNSLEGTNTLIARESMAIESLSSLLTRASGQNTLVYRDPAKPPQVGGTVTPAPQLVVDPTLPGCPVCANGEVDQGEPCDDGNSIETDACLSTCQAASCGDGFVRQGVEECDDQDEDETDGCSVTCEILTCADASGDGSVTATDALRILRHAVGQPVTCHPWVCDVSGDGNVRAGDSLMVLRRAVGLSVEMACDFVATTTTLPPTTTTVSTTSTSLETTTTTLDVPTTTTVIEPTTTSLPGPTTTLEPVTTTLISPE